MVECDSLPISVTICLVSSNVAMDDVLLTQCKHVLLESVFDLVFVTCGVVCIYILGLLKVRSPVVGGINEVFTCFGIAWVWHY